MKLKSFIAFFAITGLSLLLLAGGCRHRRMQSSADLKSVAGKAEEKVAPSDAAPDPRIVAAKLENNDSENVDFPEKEEIRRSYTLALGALVEIHGINGRVKIETADTKTAEVLIVRSAKKREDLEFRKLNIEHEPKNLTIRIENDRKSIFSALGTIPEGRQRVILRLPKEVDLETQGLNGNFFAGEIRGRMELRGISGEVKVARAAGNTEVSGVNGGIDITFAPLVGKKVEMNGVNGNIDLRFEGDVNADVDTWGVNGNVEADLPNVDRTDAEPRRGRIKARIGTGGTKIEAHGVNGNINLVKAEKAGATTAKAGGK